MSVLRHLLLLLAACSIALSAETGNSIELLSWDDIPGRTLHTHVRSDGLLRRIVPHTKGGFQADSEHHLNSRTKATDLQSFIVKYEPSEGVTVKQQIKALYSSGMVHYLPHDSFIVVFPRRVAHKVAMIPGVSVVLYMPSEMKLHPEMHEGPLMSSSSLRASRSANTLAYAKSAAPLDNLHDEVSMPARRHNLDEKSPELVELSVLIGREVGPDASNRKVVGKWLDGLDRAGLREAVVSIEDGGAGAVSVMVKGGKGSVTAVSTWLSEQGQVIWVQRKTQAVIQTMQGHDVKIPFGELQNVNSIAHLLGGRSQTEPLIWSKGIRGEDQVVAVTDTGLDYDHCAFSDPVGDDSSLIPVCNTTTVCENPGRHRKVYSYRTWFSNYYNVSADVGDDASVGHGTHVSGSIAANTFDSPSDFKMQGVAPLAKIAIEDAQAESNTEVRGLLIPSDLELVFSPSRDQGIHVHSNSWGSSVPRPVYDLDAMRTDEFAYNNPDFLVVFAAGNSGPSPMTIGSANQAKNVLTVGAGENIDEVYAGHPFWKSPRLLVEQSAFLDAEGDETVLTLAEFGTSVEEAVKRTEVVLMNSTDTDARVGCSSIRNAADLKGKVALLVEGGKCSGQAACANAESVGAAACIVIANMTGDGRGYVTPMPRDFNAPNVTIPCMSIPLDHKPLHRLRRSRPQRLEKLVNLGAVFVSLPTYEYYEPGNLAFFSSQGPTGDLDMRLKPDIVAIGSQVLSAAADQNLTTKQCSNETAARFLSGTSMSCPMISGTAALVRQYFEEGFHHTGSRDIFEGHQPSAALVKAVILHGGQRMPFPKNPRPEAQAPLFPNFQQGHGSLDLTKVLMFDDSDFKLAVFDRKNVSDGEQWALCISDVDGSVPLKVTLQWTDPPPALTSIFALVNNLDLRVENALTRKVMFGNGVPGISSATGDPMPILDALNNNEQITWEAPSSGQYRATITGFEVPMGPQAFSLVVTGSFAAVKECPVQQSFRCPGDGDCSGNGECLSSGVCVCHPTHSGADCATENAVLHDGAVVTTPAVHMTGWTFYSFPTLGMQSWGIHALSVVDPMHTSRPTILAAYNRVPTMHDHDAVGARPENSTKPELLMRWDSSITNRKASNFSASFDPLDPPKGIWVVGVWARCCGPSRLNLTLHLDERAFESAKTPASTTGEADAQESTTAQAVPRTSPVPSSSASSLSSPSPPSLQSTAMESPTTTPEPKSFDPTAAPTDVARISFSLTIPIDRNTFLASIGAYKAATASAAGVSEGSVFVIAVAETDMNTASRRLLLQAVQVDTEVTLDGESTDALEAVGAKLFGAMGKALEAQGLPRGEFTVRPFVTAADVRRIEPTQAAGAARPRPTSWLLAACALLGAMTVLVALQ